MLPLEAIEPGVGLLQPRDLANFVLNDGMPIEPRQTSVASEAARTETPICMVITGEAGNARDRALQVKIPKPPEPAQTPEHKIDIALARRPCNCGPPAARTEPLHPAIGPFEGSDQGHKPSASAAGGSLELGRCGRAGWHGRCWSQLARAVIWVALS